MAVSQQEHDAVLENVHKMRIDEHYYNPSAAEIDGLVSVSLTRTGLRERSSQQWQELIAAVKATFKDELIAEYRNHIGA